MTALPPLAERLRPSSLSDFVGQEHLLGEGKVLRTIIERDSLSSFILWGPPGVGKTTLSHIVARETGSYFERISAVSAGVGDIKRIVFDAAARLTDSGQRTILFIDEIHRFNKAQQDALLPHVENGTVILIGATTENPSFEVIPALLSRSRVFVLERLSDEQILTLLKRALKDKKSGFGSLAVSIPLDVLDLIVQFSSGDARVALNALELSISLAPQRKGVIQVSPDDVKRAFQREHLLYDKKGEEHYNTISAFIKSLRGSDPDAALYYLARMIKAGEDPLFIARRLVILASEDIGNADPHALMVAVSAFQAVNFIGFPEARITLAQAVTYLACAPKSNASYVGVTRALEDVSRYPNEPVPLHLRNAVTKLMKDVGYGKGYQYPHDFEGHHVREHYLPDKLADRRYYEPADSGIEIKIKERLAQLRKKP